MHTCDYQMHNKIVENYFDFLFLNIHKMRDHWNQIGQHATCSTKHKCKSKNQNLSYQQAQYNDLIGFQTPLQYDFEKLF